MAKKEQGTYLRDTILGANDGLVSIFGLVAGVYASGLSTVNILLSAIAGIIAGAISMGLGVYISTKAEKEQQHSQFASAKALVAQKKEHKISQVKSHYQELGFKGKLLSDIVKKVVSDKTMLLATLKQKECASGSKEEPTMAGVMTGLAFIVAAFFPIAPFVFGIHSLPIAAILTLSALFLTGILKTKWTKKPWYTSAIEATLVGLLAAAATYGIGYIFHTFFGVGL